MNDPELRNLLEKLHQEIEQADNLDDKDREMLNHVDADIRALLNRSKDEEEQPFPLNLEQLEEAIQIYQVSHPTLTILLTRLAAILSNAGI